MFMPGIWLLYLIELNEEETLDASEITSQKYFSLWEIKDLRFYCNENPEQT